MSIRPEPAAPVTWETLDWDALDTLRRRFLEGGPAGESYWRVPSDLASYDFTYAQRIGWKWDAVLRELARRGWQPPPGPLLDWGCGSGIAGRRVLGFYGAAHFRALWADDHSPLAVRFALDAVRTEHPGLSARPWNEPGTAPAGRFTTLVVSHVLNELDEAGRARLGQLLDQAEAVLWVEPGTYADSRALIAFREKWLRDFDVVAPCTHHAQCGLLHAHNAPHWCHHFAAPPAGLLSDGRWVRFGRRAGIDLRSIPYSFLVLERRGLRPPAPEALGEEWSHVIGHPRLYKGYAKILNCSREDVAEAAVWQRDNPDLFRAYRKGVGPTLLRGHAGGKDHLVIEETR